MSVDILGTSWDQCWSMVQYSFTSTETRRLVRTDSPGRPPRLSHSSWTMMTRLLHPDWKHQHDSQHFNIMDNKWQGCNIWLKTHQHDSQHFNIMDNKWQGCNIWLKTHQHDSQHFNIMDNKWQGCHIWLKTHQHVSQHFNIMDNKWQGCNIWLEKNPTWQSTF